MLAGVILSSGSFTASRGGEAEKTFPDFYCFSQTSFMSFHIVPTVELTTLLQHSGLLLPKDCYNM